MTWRKKKKYIMLCTVMVALGCRFFSTDDKESKEELDKTTEKGNNIKTYIIRCKWFI